MLHDVQHDKKTKSKAFVTLNGSEGSSSNKGDASCLSMTKSNGYLLFIAVAIVSLNGSEGSYTNKGDASCLSMTKSNGYLPFRAITS